MTAASFRRVSFSRASMRALLRVCGLVSLMWFPWPLTAAIALFSALWTPFLPLTLGILADTFYFAAHARVFPFWSLAGAGVTAVAFLVRTRIKTSIIGA